MPYIQLEDLQLFYEDIGEGEPVLFLHSGYSRGILAFSGQLQPFYAAGYRCFYPDFRGHGRSFCKNLNWDSSCIAEDMIRFMDSLDVKKVHLVGYSTGGGVAFYMAARYPERIKSLTVIGNGGVIDTAGAEEYEPEVVEAKGDISFIEKMKSLHAQAHGGDWQEYLRQEIKDWRSHPYLKEEEWKRITMPMLLIAGEKDCFATRERLEAIREKCPQADIMVVEGCGHRPHMPMEKVIEVNNKIFDFLDKI